MIYIYYLYFHIAPFLCYICMPLYVFHLPVSQNHEVFVKNHITKMFYFKNLDEILAVTGQLYPFIFLWYTSVLSPLSYCKGHSQAVLYLAPVNTVGVDMGYM